jgi:hypothetical protein
LSLYYIENSIFCKFIGRSRSLRQFEQIMTSLDAEKLLCPNYCF